jgi:hypothetical protein
LNRKLKHLQARSTRLVHFQGRDLMKSGLPGRSEGAYKKISMRLRRESSRQIALTTSNFCR